MHESVISKQLKSRLKLPRPEFLAAQISQLEADLTTLRRLQVAQTEPLAGGGVLFIFRHDGDAAAPQVGDGVALSGRDGIAPAVIVTLTPRQSATSYDVDRMQQAIAVGDQSAIWSIAAELDCAVAILKRRGATNAN